MKSIELILLLSSTALLIVAALGHWTPIGHYVNAPPRHWEQFEPELVDRSRTFNELLSLAQEKIGSQPDLSNQQKMEVLHDIVINRFTMIDAQHTFYSNYLMSIASNVHSSLGHIRSVDLMVSNGHSLLCGQSSYVLLKLAQEINIKSRHVGLTGHVVMEAWYDSDWHMYDPDQEVIPMNDDGKVVSTEELAKNPQLLQRYYGSAQPMLNAILSREDNTYMTEPQGARHAWRSNVLVYYEVFMQFAKFILPIAMICLIIIHRRPVLSLKNIRKK